MLLTVAEVATLRYGALENVVVGIFGEASKLLERATTGQKTVRQMAGLLATY